jgi:beta-phosphoglucomutase-like phosphatase (HAD superfamily)
MKQLSASRFFPSLGFLDSGSGLTFVERCRDGHFAVGEGGVAAIAATGDGKVEFVAFADRTLAYVASEMGYPAYYPVPSLDEGRPLQAVLMDLDGTTVRSEGFWIRIIRGTMAALLGRPGFELEETDLPFVSGHSVSEHLSYCLRKYGPDRGVEEARREYYRLAEFEMGEILRGRGEKDAFAPAPGVKDFLLELKALGLKLGLVTSGLYQKAYPEIKSAFDSLGMGAPEDFYDVIITAGFPLRRGAAGTLGELSPKPHPWLYAEAARVGMGIAPEQRGGVVGIEDSGAGVCSIRLAGFPAIGVAGGNIEESGARSLCSRYCADFPEILAGIRARR